MRTELLGVVVVLAALACRSTTARSELSLRVAGFVKASGIT